MDSLSDPLKKLVRLAVPIASSGILNKIASMICIIFLSALGKDQLAASSLAINSYITLLTVSATLFYSVGILCSHAVGENKPEMMRSIFNNSLMLAVVLGVPISFLLWHLSTLLVWCHQEPTLIAITIPYFHWVALSLLPTLFNMVIVQFFIGLSRPKIVLYKTVLCLPFMIILSVILILGKCGFPQLGLTGMAVAIFIVQLVSCVLLFLYVFFDRRLQVYQLFQRKLNLSVTISKQLLFVGAPIGLQIGGELSAITAATYFLGHYGVNALAAGQIVSQYVTLVVMLVLGFSQALSVLVSQCLGEKNIASILDYKRASYQIVMASFIFISVMFLVFPIWLMKPYIDVRSAHSAEIVLLARWFFALAALLLFVDSLRNMLSACLRGLHRSTVPMIVSLVCLWGISVPMAYAMGALFSSPVALRAGFASGFIVAMVVLSRYFTNYMNKL